MKTELDSYDWAEAFGEGDGGNCSPIIPQIQPPGASVDGSQFGREDVAEIFQLSEGENDAASWIVYGLLNDGRYFCVRGWCDYTGWDCQAGNSGDVAATKENIIRFGLTQEERERFGIHTP